MRESYLLFVTFVTMFFTCKNSMCSDFTWEKKFAPGNGRGLAPPLPPVFPTALYSPRKNKRMFLFGFALFLKVTVKSIENKLLITKLLQLLAINHSSSERRITFVP